MLEKAISMAANAHAGQLDKGGQPYILHPIRVMLQCETIEEKTVAMLHDLLEDTDTTEADLRAAGFSDAVIEAVLLLTKEKGADYMAYIARICENRLAARVKLADLTDNMDLNRLPGLTRRDFERLEKYILAKHRVEQALRKGCE